MTVIERQLNPDWAVNCAHMTFPCYRDFLGQIAPDSSLFACAARDSDIHGGTPAALLLGRLASGGKIAELLSIYVIREYRGKGLARLLLTDAEHYLRSRDVHMQRATYVASLPSRPALERALAACGFTPPVPFTRLYHFDLAGKVGEFFQTKRYQRFSNPSLPSRFRISRWTELTDSWREALAAREKAPGWFADWENPFSNQELIDPDFSYLLWMHDEPVGWLVAHRLAPDLLRYTHLFIRGDLRRTGMAMALAVYSFWENKRRGGARRCCFGTRMDNSAINAIMMRRFSFFAKSIEDTLVTEKIMLTCLGDPDGKRQRFDGGSPESP